MARTVAIGIQNFCKLREGNYFYLDKTDFIREWWENGDDVTLITRPRRFGKTLNMNMLEVFFSLDYAGRGDLFEELAIWENEKYRKLQGTYPVISLSFARIKEKDYKSMRTKICEEITNLYIKFHFLRDSEVLTDKEKEYFDRVNIDMEEAVATSALYQLSGYLSKYYDKKVIILLDEYDTPMQEAYLHGYWDEMVSFTRSLFNSIFKTNPYLARGIMTGILVSRMKFAKQTSNGSALAETVESIFSDLNNLKVVTTTSDEYATSFGFTVEEVFDALDECGLSDKKDLVKRWYDGFTFGKHTDIYNPWSIINYLDTGNFATYWANTSSNSLIGKLLREGNRKIKEKFELLLHGESIESAIDEQIVYNRLDGNERAVWSLLLASGYLKVFSFERYGDIPEGTLPKYKLAITNLEVRMMFQNMVHDWFSTVEEDYSDFVTALLLGDIKAMNAYMNRVALGTFSYFDTGRGPSGAEPERFYHGFVLGLLVELQDRYIITSNRESGFGRYDVMIAPKDASKDEAYILEFKVQDSNEEETLQDTITAALHQIEEKQYAAELIARGIKKEHIHTYGFAFEGKKVLIGKE